MCPRPLPDDPDAAEIVSVFDLAGTDWLLAAEGEYRAAAAETMRNDGSGHQRVVILEWPGRPNHSTEPVTVRLMMAPEDALGLAHVLSRTAAWMLRNAS